MFLKAHKSVTLLFAGIACLTGSREARATGAERLPGTVKFAGAIAGIVRNATGVPQMGASVILFNQQQKQVGKVYTDDHGEFRLLGLSPAVYFVKVTLAAFAPATREILVQPGMRSVLNVNLNSLWSTIQFAYPPVENGNIMTDDWKWVLRSAASTRPVMRFVDRDPLADPPRQTEHGSVFSETHGLVQVSAGEGGMAEPVANQADLGTAFALATSLYGNSLLEVSGNLGYGSATGAPVAAFRTSYSRPVGDSTPVASVTIRQVMAPGRLAAFSNPEFGGSVGLRSVSAGIDDSSRLGDNVVLQYGFTIDSVSFLDRMNYYSPYARLTYTISPGSDLTFAYSSGNARPGLDREDTAAEGDPLQQDLSTLGYFPRISTRNGRPQIQRGQDYEVTFVHKSGSRTYRASAYRQDITNAALAMVAPAAMYAGGGDVLPDLFSNTSVFNAGNFQSTGYSVAVTQNLAGGVSATLILGDTGALTAAGGHQELVSNSPDELRAMIREGRRRAATLRVSAVAPRLRTRLIASYQFTSDPRAIMSGNLYATDSFQPLPGLNLMVRQPLPGFCHRLEATADLRNMLAQGYLPFETAHGQSVVLMENPRSVRGGLSFVF
jgi:hypothetical protein